jgi:RNA polymerase subunit RPABC4/transcription elongation factor Spt4
MITLTREEAQQVLDALQKIYIAPEHEEYIQGWWPACEAAIDTLRARLAEPEKEQEPWQVIPESVGAKRLTEMKAKNIIDRDGFAVCGYVMDADGKVCIVHHSAVRWLSSDEMFRVMHTDAAPPQRERVYCGCGDGIVPNDGAECGTCVSMRQREWAGLTEQETGAIMEDLNAYGTRLYEFARAIEAKLKEKNNPDSL